MIKAFVFDLDGTLLNTLTSLANSYNRILKKANLPTHEVEAYKQFIGDGARVCVERCLSPADRSDDLIDKLLAAQQSDYLNTWQDEVSIYDGINDLLSDLRQQGFAIAALSNKNHPATVKCIEHFFPSHKFDVVQGFVPDKIPHKPNPSGALSIAAKLGLAPPEMVMIGDTKMDINTAKNCGMLSIGVLWGFRDQSELEQAGADHIVAQANDIRDLLLTA